LLGTAVLLFVLDWRLALATLAVIPLMSVATAIFRSRSSRAYAAVRERLGLVTATLAEDIAGMRVVQAFSRAQANTRNLPADEEPEVRDAQEARDLARIEGHVRFEHVRFRYGRGDEVLHGIELDVPAGTTVALVGHTGAGKSTIAKLPARFYDATGGRITIDGTDVRDVTQASLRRQLGVVPQEGFLFAGTLRDNV